MDPHRRLLKAVADAREVRALRPIAPAALPASPVSLSALASHLAERGTFKVEAPAADGALVLALALRDMLPGKDVDADLVRIQKVIDGREGWKVLPAGLVVRLIELIAARLRSMQVQGVADRRLDLAFSCLSSWSKRAQPGFAHGLSLSHRARTGS